MLSLEMSQPERMPNFQLLWEFACC